MNQKIAKDKGCVRFLNWCQLILHTYYIPSKWKKRAYFHLPFLLLPLALSFLKKAPASNPRPFHKPWFIYKIYNEKIEASQLSYCVAYWNAQTNPTVTKLILKNEILKASIFYLHKIIYLADYFVKTDFISLFEIFYKVLWLKYCIFSMIRPVLRHWHMSSE